MTAPFTAREQSVVDRFAAAPDAPESLRERVAEAMHEAGCSPTCGFGVAPMHRLMADAAIATITGGQS